MGIILFIVSVILLWILTPVFLLWALITKMFNFKALSTYFHGIAFAIDQLGNVMGAPIMNALLLKKEPAKLYGNPDETISHVTGVNYVNRKLTSFGYFVAHTLNFVDPNHVEKAAQNEQKN